jgi:hypothetical protein
MIVEIRAAEGGDDAKLLVADQLAIYAKLSLRPARESKRFSLTSLEAIGGNEFHRQKDEAVARHQQSRSLRSQNRQPPHSASTRKTLNGTRCEAAARADKT